MRPASLKKNLRRMTALAVSTGLVFIASTAAVLWQTTFLSLARAVRWRMARHLDYGLSFGRGREVLHTLSAT
jgi:hypothetical protein